MKNLKENTGRTNNKERKERIERAIFERAYELENKVVQMLELRGANNIDYNAIANSALKMAIEEFNTNKLYV
jgi:hypothetical protein